MRGWTTPSITGPSITAWRAGQRAAGALRQGIERHAEPGSWLVNTPANVVITDALGRQLGSGPANGCRQPRIIPALGGCR